MSSLPRSDAGTSVSLSLQVENVDATVERAGRAGATVERPPADEFYGRTAGIRDPFGHRWLLQSPLQIASHERLRHGDVAYVSLWVRDRARAADFFADVLGWRYTAGGDADGRQVEGAAPRHGMYGGQPRATLFCCYVVDDLDSAVERVRAGGGQAETPEEPAVWTPCGVHRPGGAALRAHVQPRGGSATVSRTTRGLATCGTSP